MPTYRAQVSIPYFTNLPGDVITNTLHFDPLTPLGFEETADIVTPHLITFYNQLYTASRPMATYMLPAAARVTWYDLGQPEPRVPYQLPLAPNTIPLGASTVPTEVSMVLSFQAPAVAGAPQARRRGRIYLGAIGTAWLDPATGAQFPRFTNTACTSVANAAVALLDGVQEDGVRWSVWSPTDAASALVDNGWVDNTPDTQRRRGVDATIRTTWAQVP